MKYLARPSLRVARSCHSTILCLHRWERSAGMPKDRFSGILVTWRGKDDCNLRPVPISPIILCIEAPCYISYNLKFVY